MQRFFLLLLAALLAAASAAPAQTRPATRPPAPRARSQGGLSASEAARLDGRAPRLAPEPRTARTDGVPTPEERHDRRHTENSSRRAVNRHRQDGRERD